MGYTPRPKEALQELRAHYSFVDLLYNEKLKDQWQIVCKNDDENIKITGDTHHGVLIDAVKKKNEE